MAHKHPILLVLVGALAAGCRGPASNTAQDLASATRPQLANNALRQFELALEAWSAAREAGASGRQLAQALEHAEHALDRGLVISPQSPLLLARRGQLRAERAECATEAARAEELRALAVADLRAALDAEPWFLPASLALAEHLAHRGSFDEARQQLDDALKALLELAGQRSAPRGFWEGLSDGFFGADPRATAARDERVARTAEMIAADEAWRLDASPQGAALEASAPRAAGVAVDVARYRGLLWVLRAQLEFRQRTFARAPTQSEIRDLLAQLDRAREIDVNLLEADLAKAVLHAQLRQCLQALALLEPYLVERFPRLAGDLRWVLTAACWRVDLYVELGREDDLRVARERLDTAISAGADSPTLRRARALLHLAHARRGGGGRALALAETDLDHLRSLAAPPRDLASLCEAADRVRTDLASAR